MEKDEMEKDGILNKMLEKRKSLVEFLDKRRKLLNEGKLSPEEEKLCDKYCRAVSYTTHEICEYLMEKYNLSSDEASEIIAKYVYGK